MTPARIANRETEQFALNRPDVLRVSIKDGVVYNNLDTLYPILAYDRDRPKLGWENITQRVMD